MRYSSRRLWLGLVAFTMSFAVPLYWAGVGPLFAELQKVSPRLIAAALTMVAVGWAFNAARLRLLTANVGITVPRRRAYAVVISTEFAGAATPGGVGGPLTYLYLLRRHGLDSARAASLYAVDHIMDLAFFATAFPLALLVFALGGSLDDPLWFSLAILGPLSGGVVTVIALMRHYRPLMRGMGRMLRWLRISLRRRQRIARWIIQFRHAIGLLLAMPRHRLALLYLYCAGHWLLRYSVLPLVLFGLGQNVPWSYLFLVQGALLFAGQLSMLPGGAGGVELGFAALLAAWLDPGTLALGLLLWRFVTFYWYLLLGAPVFAITTGRVSRLLLDDDVSRAGQEPGVRTE
jgi:glycosyltransferase 2 family protein